MFVCQMLVVCMVLSYNGTSILTNLYLTKSSTQRTIFFIGAKITVKYMEQNLDRTNTRYKEHISEAQT